MIKLVSVIVPAFNASRSIEACVNSICSQTYKNLQIICVNDGSTDNTIDVLHKLREQDARIIVIDKPNGGVSSARNAGLEMAEGCYVQFVDSDDFICYNMTEMLVKVLEDSHSQLVICGYQGKNLQVSLQSGIYSKNMLVNSFVGIYESTYLNPPWNKLYIREYIEEKFPEDMDLGEDLVFNLRYIKKIETIAVLDNSPYQYTIANPDSLTSKYQNNAIEVLEKKIDTILNFLPYSNYNKIRGDLAADFIIDYKRCFRSMINSGQFTDAELTEMITDILNSEMWKYVMVNYIPYDLEDRKLLSGDVRWYIRKVKTTQAKAKIKFNCKKILRKIHLYE